MFLSLIYYFYFSLNQKKKKNCETFLAHHTDLRLLNYNKQGWKQNSTTKVIEINTEEELLANSPRAEPLQIKTSTISLIPMLLVIQILGSFNYKLVWPDEVPGFILSYIQDDVRNFWLLKKICHFPKKKKRKEKIIGDF